ncbi:hypothetical protein OESDEN_01325 [Oesophagostomum dentatum]|uniref:Uncharacterized protein n=1 Tax=Oesophagostomum dentatum TaxID=61180 RepID=A0A0B1TMD1_OESDE|nr:hypothetical protein OESDEN_01325 [Oesophagostomum dentatum]
MKRWFLHLNNSDATSIPRRTTRTTLTAWDLRVFNGNIRPSISYQEQTHHHKEVFVYDGDPDSVVLEGSNQTAFLVTAYADAESGK